MEHTRLLALFVVTSAGRITDGHKCKPEQGRLHICCNGRSPKLCGLAVAVSYLVHTSDVARAHFVTRQDHKALREKFVAVSEQLQLVTREAATFKQAAEGRQEASRLALQVWLATLNTAIDRSSLATFLTSQAALLLSLQIESLLAEMADRHDTRPLVERMSQVPAGRHPQRRWHMQETDRDLHLAQRDLQQSREQLADRATVTKKLEQRLDASEATITQLRREAAETAGTLAEVAAAAAAATLAPICVTMCRHCLSGKQQWRKFRQLRPSSCAWWCTHACASMHAVQGFVCS